jgi:hypothetical protein
MDWAYGQDGGDKEFVQNFGRETSWRTSTCKILGKYVMRTGGEWNWLRIVSNGRFWYYPNTVMHICPLLVQESYCHFQSHAWEVCPLETTKYKQNLLKVKHLDDPVFAVALLVKEDFVAEFVRGDKELARFTL